MRHITLALLIVALSVSISLAQENLGARPMGMGGAFAGLADDVNAIFINPAGISSIDKESVLVSARVAEGREYTLIGGVETTPFGSLGVGYVGSTDPVDGALNTNYITQTLYLTMAKDLNREMHVPASMGNLSLGMNLKFSSRKLGNAQGLSRDSGSNIDVDLATLFKPNPDLSVGLSLQNFLSGTNSQPIPNLSTVEQRNYTVLMGASGKILDGSITWALEGEEIGCEWKPVKGLAVRAGRGKDSVSTGIGLNLNGFGVDYAYLNKTSPVHYWSVSIIQSGPASPKRASLSIE